MSLRSKRLSVRCSACVSAEATNASFRRELKIAGKRSRRCVSCPPEPQRRQNRPVFWRETVRHKTARSDREAARDNDRSAFSAITGWATDCRGLRPYFFGCLAAAVSAICLMRMSR
jgi:hypothetical protein